MNGGPDAGAPLLAETEDWRALTVLLGERAGLAFDDGRRASLVAAVRERRLATAASDLAAYTARVMADPVELQALLEAVVIGETHFWRNPPQMVGVRDHLLPELLAQAGRGGRRLRVWSAGCSTGEEPYTVAMLIAAALPTRAGWDIEVLGTDISGRSIALAEEGEYGERAVALLDPNLRARWLEERGGRWRVGEELRSLVTLRRHNLVADPVPYSPGESVDLILCRNVTIYFDRATTRSVIAGFESLLGPGGHLVLGHSETLWRMSDSFEVVRHGDAFFYRKARPQSRLRAALAPTPSERREAKRLARTLPPPVPVARRAPVVAPVAAAQQSSAAPLTGVRRALAQGRYDEAAAAAAAAAATDPLCAEAHYLLALAMVNLGRNAEALPVLRRAVYADPGLGFAHFLVASLLSQEGDALGAMRAYRAAAETLGQRPSDAHAPELDGRDVRELAELCRRLAGLSP